MSKPNEPNVSTRGRTLILKSISLFLSGRNARSNSQQPKPVKTKKMNDKDSKNKISPKLLEIAKKETHFTRLEIENLYKVYRRLISMNRPKTHQDKNVAATSSIGKTTSEGIDRVIFRELLHSSFDIVTEDMMMDRIFCVWDKTNSGLITPESWFLGLNIFLRGTLAEQTDFCFFVYDLNADGFITKDEMFQLLKNCLIKQPQDEDPDEGVKDLVEIILRKLDKDKDGKVSLDDYRTSVKEEPLLLEAFGRCLPNERATDTFITTMKM
ncbi:calaxin [Onthophagus taurus]|uniref:calaxin n=1 Tax=Onthophagus taurus TaxID=166361 RepID=UPI000C206959|nr:EF-hand calcium-binding domain-containing protein 1 [Onthophagus taurus]